MYGIDVSEHNGFLNFSKLKQNGVQFAMVRAGYGGNHIDKQFKRNINGFINSGIHTGAYWFLYSTSVAEAIKEADYFNNALKPYKKYMDFPVACDFEYDSENWMKRCGVQPNKRLNTDIVKAFCNRMEEHGWYVVNYANIDFINNHFYQNELERYDQWIAEWGPKKCSRKCGIWQFSSKEHISGSSQNTDGNYAYKDYPKIIKGSKGSQRAPKPSIKTDGHIGTNSTKAWQKVFGVVQDGIISGQSNYNEKYHLRLHTIQYGMYGSQLVRKIQEKVGAQKDGHMGYETITKWQKYIGVNPDGYFGPKTAVATQKWINTKL